MSYGGRGALVLVLIGAGMTYGASVLLALMDG